MILLGAGASKVFGLKTLQDLTKDLELRMKEKGYGDTIEDILSALRTYGLSPDFENVYVTLEALANPREGIRKSGGFTAYVAHKAAYKFKTDEKTIHDYKEILSDFRDLIYQECTIQKGVIEKQRSVLDKLFNAINRYSETRYLSSTVGLQGEERSVSTGSTVVTTNYDMAVELYHRITKKSIANGFRATQEEYVKEFDINEYGKSPSSCWLIKLHGSIWQFRRGDKVIETIAEPKSLPIEISVGEQMMIYPVGEKPILQYPYFHFYNVFKEQPWQTLVAIGHSFRDEPINIAILERLRTKKSPKPTLIVVNPEAESVVKNLGSQLPEPTDKIIPINQPFEDNSELFEKIDIALDSNSYDHYKRKIERASKL